MKTYTLNNGLIMPAIGLGTHAIPNDQLLDVLETAYDLGYRKFDTAWLYNNESVIGQFVANHSNDREKLFITSKLHFDNRFPFGYRRQLHIPLKSIRQCFFDSCKRLRTDYLDLYLIHWPFINYKKMWEEISRLYEEGYIKAIGISSFLIPHMEELKKVSGMMPMVNQFEINPYNTQKELIRYCQHNNIQVEAYATFGTKQTNDVASTNLLGEPVFAELAAKYDKQVTQIILRWAIQQGISVIPRSKSKVHLQENLELFDFALSQDEMEQIDALNKDLYHRGNPHCTLK